MPYNIGLCVEALQDEEESIQALDSLSGLHVPLHALLLSSIQRFNILQSWDDMLLLMRRTDNPA